MNAMNTMNTRPHHIGIVVSNMEKAVNFYKTFLGCEVISDVFDANDPNEANYGVKFIFLKAREHLG